VSAMSRVDFEGRLQAFGSSTFPSLRDAQRHVLAAYGESHLDTADLAIELSTGLGKTLIALLLADFALDQGKSVAYLTGSNALTAQVKDQADSLGLAAHRFWGGHYPGNELLDYHDAQAMGIMNYWVYFNSSPRVEPADLVILDDAHLAEQPLTGMFSARIARKDHEALYVALCSLALARTTAYETLQAMREGTVPASAPPELLAFNDWAAVAPQAVEIIERSTYATSDEGRFVWPELRGRLTRCGVLIGASAIEIRPYLPPTRTFAGVSESKQRIYMSATLGTMDDLERRLGLGPITRIDVPAELQQTDTGHRLFALNWGDDDSLTQPFAQMILELAGTDNRVAWLCSSHQEADQVQYTLERHYHARVFRLRPGDDTALDNWRNSAAGHLVAAGRFDGLDFPNGLCRLVVLPSVPAASSEFERFVVAYLGDATFMRHRVGQRITQALGRANRNPTDRSLYFGLDPSFPGALAQSDVFAALDANVSRVVRQSLVLQGQGPEATAAAVGAFWEGTDQQEEPAARRRPGRATGEATGLRNATDEVEASLSLWLGDFNGAARHAREASDVLAAAGEAEHSAFWRYVEAQAHFAQGGPASLPGAIDALEPVVANGPRTAWFIRLRRTLDELQGRQASVGSDDELFLNWDTWLREPAQRIERELANARAALAGSHDQRADGLLTLARLVGVWSSRPTGPSATDVRWSWVERGRAQRRVWEVKTGLASARVPRGDINQLLGQLQIEIQDHPNTRIFGCLMTPQEEMEDDAAEAAREKVCVVHEAAAMALFELLSDRFRSYKQACGRGTAAERGEARTAIEARLPAGGWLARLLVPSQGRVVRRADIEELFGHQR
jgi:hypothetical protein